MNVVHLDPGTCPLRPLRLLAGRHVDDSTTSLFHQVMTSAEIHDDFIRPVLWKLLVYVTLPSQKGIG
jgi:hypothetical protein